MRVYKILLDNLQPTTYYYCKLPVDLVKTHHWSGGGKSLLGQCTCSDKREMRDRPFDCRILCSVYGSVMREILCKETPL
jgi:hypothetical protein